MPFAPHPNLEANPNVRIFFTGLNILSSTAGNTCQAFVHNSSPVHSVTIEVRRKRQGKPDVLVMRLPGPLHFTAADPGHKHALLIKTLGLLAGDKGVKAYDGSVISTEGTKLADSFSLGGLLGGVPDIDPFGGLPSIFIDHGILYTAAKVTVDARLVEAVGGAEIKPLTEVPTIIGANIYLNPQNPAHMVQLFWRQQGKEVHLDLKPSADFTYEIYVVNEPLFIPDDPAAPKHGEFAEYFELFPDVPKIDQFELEFLGDIPERGSNRTPCMSILLGD